MSSIDKPIRRIPWPNKRRVAVSLLVLLLVFGLPVVGYQWLGIVFNDTPSIPMGFYRIATHAGPLHRGDIISFCLPQRIAQYALAHGFISRGDCQGYQALAKQVIAVPGDRVIVTDRHILVYAPTKKMPDQYHTPTHVKGKQGYVKRFIHNGTYLATGLWVYGYHDYIYSYDSRYYGQIPVSNLQHRLHPFLVFCNHQ